jgi:hypothetical protein
MDEFSYNISAKIEPMKASPGERVTVTANFTDLIGEVKTVYAMVNAYGYSQILTKSGDGSYSARTIVPYEAPPGVYNVVVFAKDIEGNRGKDTAIRFQVV